MVVLHSQGVLELMKFPWKRLHLASIWLWLFPCVIFLGGRKCHPIDLQKVVILLGQVVFWKMGSCCVSFFFRTNRSLRFHRLPNHDSYLLSWVIFLLSLQKFLLATSGGFPAKVMNTNMATRPSGFASGDVMLKDSKHRNPLTSISVLGEQSGVFSSSQRMQHVVFKNLLI